MAEGTPDPSVTSRVREVGAWSADLKKELGLRDLVLAQLLVVLGTAGLGTAAKAGSAQMVLWLAAILFFYLPLTMVVIHLSRLLPLEGGLYQWARLGFGDLAGFMVAWNYWLFGLVFLSSIGLTAATSLSYALGPPGAWMATSKWVIALSGALVVAGFVVVGIRGLAVGKWVHDAGSALQLGAFAMLLGLLLLAPKGAPDGRPPIDVALPALTVLNLTLFVKTAVFGLGGFEYVAILAGECRDPGRTIGRSVAIAAPLIALLYILGTSSLLAFVQPQDVDLINPIAQALTAALPSFRAGGILATILILAMFAREIAQQSCIFTGNTRLPLVAGWDRLLPAGLSRLHPRHKTPVNAILLGGALTLGFGSAGIVGAGAQEAYQLLLSATGIFVATTNLVMFALPLFGRGIGASPRLRGAALSGFLMVLLFILLSLFPIVDVASVGTYAAKVGLVVVAANTIGYALYRLGRKPGPRQGGFTGGLAERS